MTSRLLVTIHQLDFNVFFQQVFEDSQRLQRRRNPSAHGAQCTPRATPGNHRIDDAKSSSGGAGQSPCWLGRRRRPQRDHRRSRRAGKSRPREIRRRSSWASAQVHYRFNPSAHLRVALTISARSDGDKTTYFASSEPGRSDIFFPHRSRYRRASWLKLWW